jgi:hypothetical protein
MTQTTNDQNFDRLVQLLTFYFKNKKKFKRILTLRSLYYHVKTINNVKLYKWLKRNYKSQNFEYKLNKTAGSMYIYRNLEESFITKYSEIIQATPKLN